MVARCLFAAMLGLVLAGGTVVVAEGCSTFQPDAEASPEASPEAASPTSEAGPQDGGIDATSDAGSFCATQLDASFCTDFEMQALDAGFDNAFVSEGEVMLLEGGAPLSPPHAFQASTSGATGAPPASGTIKDNDGGVAFVQGATLLHSFSGAPTGSIVLDADLRIDELPPAGVSTMISALIVTGTAASEADQSVVVGFEVDAASTKVVGVLTVDLGNGVQTNQAFPLTKPIGGWFHVQLTANRTQNGSVTLLVDGAPAGAIAPTPVLLGRSFFALGVGIVRLRGDARTGMSYDNVVLSAP